MSALSSGRLLRAGAGLLVLLGLAGLVWAGLSASPYYAPFDPRDPCLVHGFCDPAVVDDGQRTWWLRALGAAAVVALGLLLALAARPAQGGEGATRRPRSPRQRAAGAGLIAAAVAVLGALPLALTTLAAPQLGFAVVAWLAICQAWVLDWWSAPVDGLAGRPRARLAGTLLAAGAGWLVAGGVVLAVGTEVLAAGPVAGLLPLMVAVVVLDGLVVALVTAGVHALAARGRGVEDESAPAPGGGSSHEVRAGSSRA